MSAVRCAVAVNKWGASWGRVIFIGCGSNVTTTGVPSAEWAWRADVEITA